MNTPGQQPEFAWIPEWKGLSKLFLKSQKKQDIANGRSLRIFVYPWGFHWINGVDELTVQWSDVVAIFQHVIRHSTNGAPTYTEYHYTMQLTGKRRRTIKANLRPRAAVQSQRTRLQAVPGTTIPVTIEQLGRLLESGVTRDQLPKAIERFNAGQAVSFGPLTVSPAGLSSGENTVPWNEVQGVRTSSGYVSVKKAGKWLSWKRVAVATIPNYFVFDALVQAVIAQRQHALRHACASSARPSKEHGRPLGRAPHPARGRGACRLPPVSMSRGVPGCQQLFARFLAVPARRSAMALWHGAGGPSGRVTAGCTFGTAAHGLCR